MKSFLILRRKDIVSSIGTTSLLGGWRPRMAPGIRSGPPVFYYTKRKREAGWQTGLSLVVSLRVL